MEGGQPTVSEGVPAGNGLVTSDAALAELAVEAFLLERVGGVRVEMGEGVALQLDGWVTTVTKIISSSTRVPCHVPDRK